MTTSIYTRMTERSYREFDIYVTDSVGNIIDLTDVVLIKWGMSANEHSTTTLLERSYPSSGIVVTMPTSGLITVAISGAQTTGLGGDSYFQQCYYDMHGQLTPVVKGVIRIDPIII